jgi:transposase
MEVIVACCAGLDVHQASVVACVNSTGRGGRSHKEVRTFGTMRDDLIALRDWLKDAGVTLVAMESTGVYWKPVYDALEDHFETVVVNAQHIKNARGSCRPGISAICANSTATAVKWRRFRPGNATG